MSQIAKYQIWILILILVSSGVSCKKWIEVSPPIDKPDASVIYSSDALATAVLTGMYNQISAGSFATGNNSISVRSGMSADELTGYSSSGAEAFSYYQNNIPNTTTRFWLELYKYLYTCNSAIEGVGKSTQLSPQVKKQLLGEAKFMRAFLHFYLVNLFGDIPMALSTDFNTNSNGTRIPKADVYKQIIQDLKDAQDLLNDNYVSLDLVSTTTERIRPNKSAATAMLSRVYLFKGDFSDAEIQATAIIDNKNLYDTVKLSQVFLANSKETVWQLQPVLADRNTQDGYAFILSSAPNSARPVSISPQLYGAFESGDERKNTWIKTATFSGVTYYSPYKYKVQTGGSLSEYLIVLRLGEQYLIRAEARAQLNKISEAQQDINVIRKRARLPNTTASDKPSLLMAIEQERRIELFSEWGHRWLDLKRTNRVDAVMGVVTPIKGGGTWQSYKQLYPIPQGDIDKSYSLTQNPGY